mgnify:CR=1 FL=1
MFALVIIGLTAKVFFGGLNINFLEQRLSLYLKNEREITLKSDDYILMHSQENGLFIDVSKTDLSLNEKTSFNANQIIIDFDLYNLFFSNDGRFITVMIDQIAIKSVELSNEIVLQGSILEIKLDSLTNIENSKISMSSALLTGDDIFYEKFYFDFKYDFVNREFNILSFNYGDIFISGPSYIKYNLEKNLWQTKIEIKAKKEPLKTLLNITNNTELDKFVSGFIGWQTFSVTSEFETINQSLLQAFVDEMEFGEKISQQKDEIYVEVESCIKYKGYIKRQNDLVQKLKKQEGLLIPKNTNYYDIKSISKEAQEKLSLVRPETLGQATRVSGVTPADISVLSVAFFGNH